jgi:hypothetical protein
LSESIRVKLDGPPVIRDEMEVDQICMDCLAKYNDSMLGAVGWLYWALATAAATGMGMNAATLRMLAIKENAGYIAEVRSKVASTGGDTGVAASRYLRDHPSEKVAELRLRADRAEREERRDVGDRQSICLVIKLLLRQRGPLDMNTIGDILFDTYDVPFDPVWQALQWLLRLGEIEGGGRNEPYRLSSNKEEPRPSSVVDQAFHDREPPSADR